MSNKNGSFLLHIVATFFAILGTRSNKIVCCTRATFPAGMGCAAQSLRARPAMPNGGFACKNDELAEKYRWHFGQKSIESLEGLNHLYLKQVQLPFHCDISLRYTDGLRYPTPVCASPGALDMFAHYMSSCLIVVKPPQLSKAQTQFLEWHRAQLTITKKDYMAEEGVKAHQLFLETDDMFTVPREYALTLYGSAAFLPHVHVLSATDPFAAAPSAFAAASNAFMAVLQRPQLKPQPPRAVFSADELARLREPVPEHVLRPPFLQTLPHALDDTLPLTHRTRPLCLAPGTVLREAPVDQLPVVLGTISHWRRAYGEKPDTLPSFTLVKPCGTGKTLEAITAWLWTCRTDLPLHLSPQSDAFRAVAQMHALRQQTPEQAHFTAKALFVVHKHDLVEQMCENLAKYVPGVAIDVIVGSKRLPDPASVDVLVVSIDTIASSFDAFPPGYFDTFSIMVMDEAHTYTAEFFSSALLRLHAPSTSWRSPRRRATARRSPYPPARCCTMRCAASSRSTRI